MASKIVAMFLWLGSVIGLRDFHVSVPEAVTLGSNPILGCHWTLDPGESLYSVKWYRGAYEFFRFVPTEVPNTMVFSLDGISIDVSKSGAKQVALQSVTRGQSGRYRCEVTADAPSFYTAVKSAIMNVIEVPASGPVVRPSKTWISSGDILSANCSVPAKDPPANLTWFVNGKKVNPEEQASHSKKSSDQISQNIKRIIFTPWEENYPFEESVTLINNMLVPIYNTGIHNTRKVNITSKNLEFNNEEGGDVDKSYTLSKLELKIKTTHFRRGQINVTCVARILSIWSAADWVMIDEELPQIAPVMRSVESNSGAAHHFQPEYKLTVIVISLVLCIEV